MDNAVDLVWEGMQSGKLAADQLPPLTVDEGQALQAQVLSRWLAAGENLAGYKVALTSGAARNAFGAGVRPFGYLLGSRVLDSGTTLSRANVGNMGLENELVFRLRSSLQGPDVTRDQVLAALDGVAPGFEINQDRGAGKASPGARVAENLSQWGIVKSDWRKPPASLDDLIVTLSLDSAPLQTVAATNHIDDHYLSICALVAQLHRFGRQLAPGDLVITGSFTRISLDREGIYTGDFGSLGTVVLTVTA
ncbi:MAG: 2-keto-4-pentenoate hydratase [Pseudomonadota bacterium]